MKAAASAIIASTIGYLLLLGIFVITLAALLPKEAFLPAQLIK